jgi:hypothetical protein
MYNAVGKGAEKVRIPKVFAEKTAKRFKIPISEQYMIPLCVDQKKTCPYFSGMLGGSISCTFEVGKPPEEKEKKEAPPKAAPEGEPAPQGVESEHI